MLTLPIKKQWFDLIRSGIKKEEYRSMTEYYKTRFQNIGLLDAFGISTGKVAQIVLRAGYRKDSPKLTITARLSVGKGWPAWGAVPNCWYYVLRILDVMEDGDQDENRNK